MFYNDVSNQIQFLIVVCFSLLIFVFSLSLNKGQSLLKLSGTTFFAPLFLSVSSFLCGKAALSASLLILGEAALLFALAVILSVRPKSANHSFVQFILFIVPPVLLWLVVYEKPVSGFLNLPYTDISLLALGTLVNMFFLRKEKGPKGKLFWGMLCLLAGSAVKEAAPYFGLVFTYLSLLLRLSAYIVFLLYFYRESYKRLTAKMVEAEKKMSDMNKTVELEIKRRTFDIERSNKKLLDISKTDALTKAVNKATLLDIIETQISAKGKSPFSILMFDIDNFKIINDTLGHISGDNCLRKLSQIAKNSIREVDTLGRYGGDEFIIVLPGAAAPQAKLIAERFRKKVEETESPHFTVSVGVATFPEDGATVKDLIAMADEGLYLSKKKGRNAVSHKSQTP